MATAAAVGVMSLSAALSLSAVLYGGRAVAQAGRGRPARAVLEWQDGGRGEEHLSARVESGDLLIYQACLPTLSLSRARSLCCSRGLPLYFLYLCPSETLTRSHTLSPTRPFLSSLITFLLPWLPLHHSLGSLLPLQLACFRFSLSSTPLGPLMPILRRPAVFCPGGYLAG